MNKKMMLFINSVLLTLCCYGQICNKSFGGWMKTYPLSAIQFEQNEGLNGTFTFGHGLQNLKSLIFLPEDCIRYKIENVSHFKLLKYSQTTKWDEVVWLERESIKIQYKDGHKLVNGNIPYDKFFSVLNSKGKKEKVYENQKIKYKRDDQGRVFMVFIYNHNDLLMLYRYTYEHSTDINRITKIEQFSSSGERCETTEFAYDGNNLISATTSNTDERISMIFKYDTYDNPESLYHSVDDKIHNRTNVTEYKLSYEYFDGKISSCLCRWGESSNECEQWNFKYDDKGNWTEIIIPTYGTKWIREIMYK